MKDGIIYFLGLPVGLKMGNKAYIVRSGKYCEWYEFDGEIPLDPYEWPIVGTHHSEYITKGPGLCL
jgi:hypothetical protein